MTSRACAALLVVSLVVVLSALLLPDAFTISDMSVAAFGFLAAPFKLVGKVGAAVVKVAKKAPRFVARNATTIASTFIPGASAAIAGLEQLTGRGRAPPDLAFAPFDPSIGTASIVERTQDFPVSSRFNLAATFEGALRELRGEAQKLVTRASETVTVKPRLSGPLPVALGIAGTVGVLGLIAGAVALARG